MLRLAVITGVVCTLGLPIAAQAKFDGLGCASVGFITDRDVIRVPANERRYDAIKLEVKRNAVNLIDLKVVYGNGNADDLQVRSIIKPGGETRTIDLKGKGGRRIRSINFVYRSPVSLRGMAEVCAYGRRAR